MAIDGIQQLFTDGVRLRKQLRGNMDGLREALNRFVETGMTVSLVKLSADELAVQVAECLALMEGARRAPSKKEQQLMLSAAYDSLRDALMKYSDRAEIIRDDD